MKPKKTAEETFWEVLEAGKIPVAVSIIDDYGEEGLAALGVPFKGNQKAEELIFSHDWRQRTAGIVMAIDHAREKIDEHFDDVHLLI